MSNNLENERSVTSGKMYPIDLAPQKITIVKSVSNAEVKMAHLIPGQAKTSSSGQIIAHTGPVSLMRPAAQIISPTGASQPQMIVSGSPILQGSQGSQLLSQSTQIISQSQLISPSGQILSPATQIISQGSQLSAQVSNANTGINTVQTSVSSSSGTQILNVSGQIVGGGGNLVVSSSVRTLPPSVRVLSPLPHHNTRPVLSTVNVSSSSGVLVSKTISMTSHVPRGLAAGASLAVRPVTPTASQGIGSQGGWSSSTRGPRGALVYGARATAPRAPGSRPITPTGLTTTPTQPISAQPSLTTTQTSHNIVSLSSTTVLTTSGVISSSVRSPTPRLQAPASTSLTSAPRPLPLLQRNYQPKVLGVANVGVRGVVGNSAPAQLYYEVPRAAAPHTMPQRSLTPFAHAPQPQQLAPQPQIVPQPQQLAPQPQPQPQLQSQQTPQSQPTQVNTVPVVAEVRAPSNTVQTAPVVPRPSILRKRDIEVSPTKVTTVAPIVGPPLIPVSTTYRDNTGWEDVPGGGGGPGSGGSTTISASSSPAPDDETDQPRTEDVSPRKKPRKQLLTNELRQCEYIPEETPPTPSPVTVNPPPKRPLLSSSYVCGWRSTALHFTRPSDVRRREPRAKDILAIASQKHVLTSADGWKVHHLTAQMDDLVSLEADVGEQLASLLRALETASGRAIAALQPHSHTMLELLKGNIQRSKIVCEGIQEAREDILRVFTHRNFVSEILTRQADKRCFRKHRSQS